MSGHALEHERWTYDHLDYTDTGHVVSESSGGRGVALVPFASSTDEDPSEEAFALARDRARLIAAAPDLLRAVLTAEWGGTRLGPGYEEAKSCPVCGGVKPGDQHAHLFAAAAVGHRPACPLSAAILKATGGDV